jgi:hypothetical protein
MPMTPAMTTDFMTSSGRVALLAVPYRRAHACVVCINQLQ